ncbi:MAG TPA: NAD(P)-binding domain-containing protein [Nitrososphaeraceae archaeon]|nr:NAD(P)-binding domain-containing protein [Nitrososphaeraceae archaeon]
MSNSINTKLKKVLVIGLGQLGLPVAKYVNDKGFDVSGYDISTDAMIRAQEKIGLKTTTDFRNFDIYIICVSTHNSSNITSPQIEGLISVINKISTEANNGSLVSIESTIPKGTSKKIFELLEHRLHVVHAPHRWYSLDEEKYGVNQLRVIGGVNPCCLKLGLEFYAGNSKCDTEKFTDEDILNNYNQLENTNTTFIEVQQNFNDSNSLSNNNQLESQAYFQSLEIPMHSVSSIEVAELTKIIENSHRYLQIAFAEELYLYCQANNILFSELRDALNTKWNVEILEPRDGIGGHCLPKDTKMFLSSKMRSKILQSAMEVDTLYRDFLTRREKKLITSVDNLTN